MVSSGSTAGEAAERYAEAVAVRMAGATHQRQGDFHRSLVCLATAREMFAQLAHDDQVAWTMLDESRVLGQVGRAEEALERLAAAGAAFERLAAGRAGALAACQQGDALRRLGRLDAAGTAYDTGLARARAGGHGDALAACLIGRAGLHLARQDAAAAGRDLAEAAALRSGLRPGPDDVRLACRQAGWAAAGGQAEVAARHGGEARRLAAELGLEQDRSEPELLAELRELS